MIDFGFFAALMSMSFVFWYVGVQPANRRQMTIIALGTFILSAAFAVAAATLAARVLVFVMFAGWHVFFALVQLAIAQDLDNIARRLDAFERHLASKETVTHDTGIPTG